MLRGKFQETAAIVKKTVKDVNIPEIKKPDIKMPDQIRSVFKKKYPKKKKWNCRRLKKKQL